MKTYIYLFFSFLIMSCSTKSDKNFIVNCKIYGLQKGTIYLEKFENNKLVVIDSVSIKDGTEEITFSNNITEPDIFIVSLEKSNSKHISFFGEPGTVNISTSLDKFYLKAKIKGSKQQELLEKHDEYIKKITDVNLDLIKEKFEAQKNNDLETVDEIEFKQNKNLKKQYLFSANYAISNKNNAVAPFIACTRMQKATLILKQKIYDALTPKIKESKYGKLLKESLN